jgi:outer membrane murein-binding lipoprotein Lpp
MAPADELIAMAYHTVQLQMSNLQAPVTTLQNDVSQLRQQLTATHIELAATKQQLTATRAELAATQQQLDQGLQKMTHRYRALKSTVLSLFDTKTKLLALDYRVNVLRALVDSRFVYHALVIEDYNLTFSGYSSINGRIATPTHRTTRLKVQHRRLKSFSCPDVKARILSKCVCSSPRSSKLGAFGTILMRPPFPRY